MKSSLLFGLLSSLALSLVGVACNDGEPDVSGIGGAGGTGGMGGEPGSGGAPSCASSQVSCEGVCTNLKSDPQNCGDCAQACGANQGCVDGTCQRFGCATGQVECDGACTSLQTDPTHCGSCEKTCASGELCSAGTCVLSCPMGTVACDGTCIDPTTDRQHCGATSCDAPGDGQGGAGGAASGVVCGAAELCVQGVCTRTCSSDELICGNRCIDPATDEKFCGATDCASLDGSGDACEAGGSCVGGECQCPENTVACGGTCTDPLTDAKFCGATTCADDATDGEVCAKGEACQAGVCTTSCPGAQVACEGSCIDPATNREYCGATTCVDDATDGEACANGEVCQGGVCSTSCPGAQVVCGDACIDPATNREYCGATTCVDDATDGEACPSGQVCAGGSCQTSCLAGQVACGGGCITPETDPVYCGATTCADDATDGETCAAGTVCVNKVCETSCPVGQVVCAGRCVSPSTDREYCGAQGDCSAPTNDGAVCGAGSVCSAGVCTTSCGSGQVDCNGSCVDPLTDRTHCGVDSSCQGGDTCVSGEVCSAGVCGATCPNGQFVCSGSCVNPQTSTALCGASDCAGTGGQICGNGQACVNGSCVAFVQWQPGARVDQGANAADTEQSIATDSGGNAVLVFRQRAVQGDTESLRLFGAYYSATTEAWTAPVQIDLAANKVRSLRVDMNDAGVAVATWIADTDPVNFKSVVRAARFFGGSWSAPVTIDGNVIEFPSVYVDNLGQGAIVYSKEMDDVLNGNDPDWQVFGATMNASGTVGTPVAISDFSGANYQATNPRIAGNSAGAGMAVYWQAVSGATRNVYAIRYSSSTGFEAATAKTIVNGTIPTGFRVGAPDVAVDAAGKAYVVWSQMTARYSPGGSISFPLQAHVFANVFSGSAWETATQVTNFSDAAVDARVSANLGAVGLTFQRYSTTATTSAPTSYQIYGQRYSSGAWIDQQLLDGAAQAAPQPLPNVGVGGTGDIHFVWANGSSASTARYTQGAWTSVSNLATGGPGTGAVQWPVLAPTPTVEMFASWVQNIPGLSGNHVIVSRYE